MISKCQSTPAVLHYKKVRADVALSSLSRVFGSMAGASILGANATSRYSYWMAEPVQRTVIRPGHKPLEQIDDLLGRYRLGDSEPDLPGDICVPGWAGYLSYDLCRYIADVGRWQNDDLGVALAQLNFYDRSICYDHARDVFYLMALQLPGQSTPVDKLDFLCDLLSRAGRSAEPQLPGSTGRIGQPTCNMSKEYYTEAAKRILRYIYDGQVYQVNLSRRLAVEFGGEALELFDWQNRHNPSPYAAYLDCQGHTIVSASPELFLEINGRQISTEPIKGTRRRYEPVDESAKLKNLANYNELLHSAKEQAELNMIIDLERNDIARVCVPGTRGVVQSRHIRSYATVFHALGRISGRLRADVSTKQMLEAVFPGGSITGAPKISAMRIINDLEPTARGPYTGSVGVFGINGNACLNIAIRTIIIKARKAYVQVGGGIVADSDPQAEWHETNVKARALLAGISEVNRL